MTSNVRNDPKLTVALHQPLVILEVLSPGRSILPEAQQVDPLPNLFYNIPELLLGDTVKGRHSLVLTDLVYEGEQVDRVVHFEKVVALVVVLGLCIDLGGKYLAWRTFFHLS